MQFYILRSCAVIGHAKRNRTIENPSPMYVRHMCPHLNEDQIDDVLRHGGAVALPTFEDAMITVANYFPAAAEEPPVLSIVLVAEEDPFFPELLFRTEATAYTESWRRLDQMAERLTGD